MKPQGYIVILIVLILCVGGIAASFQPPFEVDDVAVLLDDHRVNPSDWSSNNDWYQNKYNNCTLHKGDRVTVVDTGANSSLLVTNSSCQGWVHQTWVKAQ